MSRRRKPRPAGYHFDVASMVVRPDGLPACRWCKGPVEKPKKNWCGNPDCLWEWQRRTDWSLTRLEVFRRGNGACALCGRDVAALDPGPILEELHAALRLRQDIRDILARLAAAHDWCRANRCRTAWEADHIVPVCEGGDYFRFENLRVLCSPCHKRETAALAARRAAARTAPGAA